MDGGDLLFDLPRHDRPRGKPRRAPQAIKSRPQPIRDAIMAFLDEPRTATQVAARIGRKTSVATGHLRAMRLKGLAVRVGWGVWLRRDCCANPPATDTIRRTTPLQDIILQHLRQPKTLDELHRQTGQLRSTLKACLARMMTQGVIEPQGEDQFTATFK